MTATTYYNIDKLCAAVEAASAGCDVVSLDLFDTLIVRRVHDPDLIKLPVSVLIARLSEQAGRPWIPEKVMRFRNKVEAMHRRRAGRAGPDREARYPDFMRDVLARILGRDDVAAELERVTGYELSLEVAMAAPRQQFVELLRRLRAAGKRVFFVSDIYLPSSHLKRILGPLGVLELAEDVVSSADAFQAKASGAAWPVLRDRFKLDPARWVHFGDNPVSDGARPAEFGIRSFVLRDGAEKWRKALSRMYWHISNMAHFWKGRLLQQWMLPLEGENVPRDELYRAGYTFFGPMLCAYIQWIAERAREAGVKRIYFFSREGQILHEVWKRVTPVLYPEGGVPPAHYLYVSRLALAGPSCAHRGLPEESAMIAFLPPQNRDFRDLCRVFSLDAGPFEKYLRRFRIAADTPISHWHGAKRKERERFLQMLRDPEFQDEVKRQARESNDALQRYLESEKFFEQDEVAVVDIGWLGTIQRFLFNAVDHRKDRPRFHGYLFGATGGYPFPASRDNHVQAFVYDHARFDFTGSSILYEQDIFEEAIRAPHAGLMGYAKKGDGFELKFRPDDAFAEHERNQSAHYAPLQQGVLDAADRYGPAAAVIGLELRHLKYWTNYLLVSRMAFPKTSEILNLRHIHHLDEFSGTHRPNKLHKRIVGRRLWNRSPAQLRFVPFLRTLHFLRHAMIMLSRG